MNWLDKTLNQPRSFAGQTFSINKGDTLKGFIARLQRAGIIDEPYSLALYARYKGLAGKLHTGQYIFTDDAEFTDGTYSKIFNIDGYNISGVIGFKF
jgi:cell division protein YceG involved in septum cleavage